MIVMALARQTSVRNVGVCHDAEYTALDIAGHLGLEDPQRLVWRAGGINHMTWFLGLEVDGHDVYPELRARAASGMLDNDRTDAVRIELLRRFGYFVSESSVHNAEYYPWFISREGAAERYGVRLREYLYRLDKLEQEFQEARRGSGPAVDTEEDLSPEYAPKIISALETNEAYSFMGNVANEGNLIANLPDDCCVEVPCLVKGGTIVPGRVGKIPEQCAGLNRTAINVQLLAVQGILNEDRDALRQAAYMDPLLSAQLGLHEISNLIDDLLAAHEKAAG